jgi:hypothetical protein
MASIFASSGGAEENLLGYDAVLLAERPGVNNI